MLKTKFIHDVLCVETLNQFNEKLTENHVQV